MWAEFRLYFEGVAFGPSLDEGYVFSIDLFGTEKIRERHQDVFALGQQNHSAGLEIETVRIRQVSQPVLDRPRLLLSDGCMKQLHQVGTGRIVTVRRGQQ